MLVFTEVCVAPYGLLQDSPETSVFLVFFYALCPETLAMTVDNWGAFGERRKRVYL